MIVFILLVVIGGAVTLGALLRLPGFNSVRGRMRWGMALLYIGFGAAHLTVSHRFLPIMPPQIPMPEQVVLFTGVCEILGGLGLLQPATRRWAGVLLAIYAVCVYPANIYHAVARVDVPGIPSGWWYHGPRLLLQPVLVWWALFSPGVINWPFDDPRPEFAKRGLLGAAPPRSEGGLEHRRGVSRLPLPSLHRPALTANPDPSPFEEEVRLSSPPHHKGRPSVAVEAALDHEAA